MFEIYHCKVIYFGSDDAGGGRVGSGAPPFWNVTDKSIQ